MEHNDPYQAVQRHPRLVRDSEVIGDRLATTRAVGHYQQVSDPDFEAHYERLLKVLDGAVQLLWSHGEDHWGAWLERQRGEIAGGNRYALDHLLSGFGGMGGFNDLVIHPINGHAIAEGDVDGVNKLLQAYLSEPRCFGLSAAPRLPPMSMALSPIVGG